MRSPSLKCALKTVFGLFLALTFRATYAVQTDERPIRIAWTDTPFNQPYKAKLQAVYSSLNYEVNWVPMPVERAIVEVGEGRMDANLYVAIYVREMFSKAFLVRHDLFDIDAIMLCRDKSLCDESVLQDKRNAIVGPSLARRLLKRHGYAIRHQQVEDILSYFPLLQSGRFNYVLTLSDPARLRKLKAQFGVYLIESIPMYHMIAPHREDLAEALTAAYSPAEEPLESAHNGNRFDLRKNLLSSLHP